MLFRPAYRYHATLMRARFDQNKNLKDIRIAYEMLAEGEKELHKHQHWTPRKCKYHVVFTYLHH